jgi:hypothetical protein
MSSKETFGELNAENDLLLTQNSALRKDFGEVRAERDLLLSQMSALRKDLEEQTTKYEEAEAIVQALLGARIEDLGPTQSGSPSVLSTSITPRMVLLLRMLEPTSRDDRARASTRFSLTHRAEDLSWSDFDVPFMEGQHLTSFADSVIPRSPRDAALQDLKLVQCSACKVWKFTVGLPNTTNLNLNQFSRRFRTTACCSALICIACLGNALKRSLADDWWNEIGSQSWLKCPIEECGRPIGIRGIDYITEILRDSSNQDVLKHTSMLVHEPRRHNHTSPANCMPTGLSEPSSSEMPSNISTLDQAQRQ